MVIIWSVFLEETADNPSNPFASGNLGTFAFIFYLENTLMVKEEMSKLILKYILCS